MDISGPVRAALRQFSPAENIRDPADAPLTLFVRAIADPQGAPGDLPPLFPLPESSRTVHNWFTLAAMMRIVPRLHRSLRSPFIESLREPASRLIDASQVLLTKRDAAPLQLLWHHFLLALAAKRLALPIPDPLIKGLLHRGLAAQTPDGRVAKANADISMDAALYDELAALHAAYNAALLLHDYDRIPQIEKAIRWHVANTQPDHITTEPWALAAFANLDDTQTFAPQQLHDATSRLAAAAPPAIILALLADALLTQEEAAHA